MLRAILTFVLWLSLSSGAGAVIFFSTGDPEHNTSQPTGSLTNSGWQFEGDWSAFLGTPIAPRYFLAAAHVGVALGEPFFFRGVRYETTGRFPSPNTDLVIFSVDRPFPEFAPMLDHTNSLVGKQLMVIGRGTQRGAEVHLNGELHGWEWGATDNRRRWGLNNVTGLLNFSPAGSAPEWTLTSTFDAAGGADECTFSGGDSSGAMFIKDNGVWKLAAINYAVDSPFNTTSTGDGFYAALFDYGGYFVQSGGDWAEVPDFPQDLPATMYGSLVPTSLEWINSIISQPPPVTLVLEEASEPSGPFSKSAGATVDASKQTVDVAAPSGKRFFRLNAERNLRITLVERAGNRLLIHFAGAN